MTEHDPSFRVFEAAQAVVKWREQLARRCEHFDQAASDLADARLVLEDAEQELRAAIDHYQDLHRKDRLSQLAGQLLGTERDGLVEGVQS